LNREKNPKAEPGAAHADDGAPGLRALLSELGGALDAACDALDRARQRGSDLPAAAGAILDHYPLADSHLRQARGQLLNDGGVLPVQGGADARILVLARDAAARDEGRIDRAGLARLLAGSQQDAPLQLAELRLFPAALRVALLDALRHIAVRCARAC
jgi:hypothetical protein